MDIHPHPIGWTRWGERIGDYLCPIGCTNWRGVHGHPSISHWMNKVTGVTTRKRKLSHANLITIHVTYLWQSKVTMFQGKFADIFHIQAECRKYPWIFPRILSVPQNILMDMTIVMDFLIWICLFHMTSYLWILTLNRSSIWYSRLWMSRLIPECMLHACHRLDIYTYLFMWSMIVVHLKGLAFSLRKAYCLVPKSWQGRISHRWPLHVLWVCETNFV